MKQTESPQVVGQALPSDPRELIKLLKLRSRQRPLVASEGYNGERDRAQDLNREKTERKIMSLEDYIYTDEGRIRAQQHEDHVKMEAEDILSAQEVARHKEQLKLDFRAQIRKEAEERQKAELLEKEERKKAAEIRRLAVVERIRKQKEEEEMRLRAAELELIKIEQEKLRAQQVIIMNVDNYFRKISGKIQLLCCIKGNNKQYAPRASQYDDGGRIFAIV